MSTLSQYIPSSNRYKEMIYRRCGKSGLKLPVISLGLWHNFGGVNDFDNSRSLARYAFDNGITYFDLANNYGPPYGSAEQTMGKLLKDDFAPYRDELIISTKAGYDMWDGPYGDFGSRKYLLSSLDQSLKRLNLDYVDIFYHHRMDPETPLEESMGALAHAVHSGKALYVGISNYDAKATVQAEQILRSMGIHCLVSQPPYSMLNRKIEINGSLSATYQAGIGCVCYSPLAQGILSGKYNNAAPKESRASSKSPFLSNSDLTPSLLQKVQELGQIAQSRGQSMSQLALAWVLREPCITSAIIGARTIEQLKENIATIDNLLLTSEELTKIDNILSNN